MAPNPSASASSTADSSRRVLPIPGSPSSVTADNPREATATNSLRTAAISRGRPITEPVTRRICRASGQSAC